ncbi:hypothetical protein [Devosia sediminis]|uniref:Uncharacterized protein n=1 Tax=Devosia sediminis TaxID=2798801 RepID=A0A934IS04_9HYPH|nr:hypothetical protein [Devosia sediminis]MBJ3785723.1 hypothetical protein [Devosia sediminis]
MEFAADIQLYVRLISGTILGLSVGKLLSGTAKFIQHPHEYRINWLHALWIVFLFGSIIIFWWQEALTFSRVQWSFPLYAFQIAYCGSFLFITAILLPDEVTEFDTHYEYFMARRVWFYGALIVSYLLGIGNAVIKDGWEESFLSPEYIILNLVMVAILVAGMVLNRPRLQLGIAAFMVLLTVLSALLE